MKPSLCAIVGQKPIKDVPGCPRCFAGYSVDGETTTLLAWAGSVNPNHQWQYCTCQACRFSFTVERKGEHVWVTDGGARVLMGIAACFEPYIYTCNKCGGDVHRLHTHLDGKTPAKYLRSQLTDDGWRKAYRTFYKCANCDNGVEVSE